MAICVAQVAATGADLSSDDALDPIAESFCRWRTDGATDIGNQTRSVLSRARHLEGHPSARLREAASDDAARRARAAGNGALMRRSIVGLTALNDRDATATNARAVAELTHADLLAGDPCVLWSDAIRVAVLEGRLDVMSGLDLIPATRRDQWRGWVDDAESKPPSSFSPNGFTVTALQAAWAAIAGGLLGAYWGASAVPDEWKELAHGWPGVRAEGWFGLPPSPLRAGAQRLRLGPEVLLLGHERFL